MGHSHPNYNSSVSTFCNVIANDLSYAVNDRSTELELLYIDDLVEAMFDLLEGKEQHCEYPKSGEMGPEASDGTMSFPDQNKITIVMN